MSALVTRLRAEIDAILVRVRGPIADARRAVYADFGDRLAQRRLGQLTAEHARRVLALNDAIGDALRRSWTLDPAALAWLEGLHGVPISNLLAAGSADNPDTTEAALGFFALSLDEADRALANGGAST